jgi:hypothetical protein
MGPYSKICHIKLTSLFNVFNYFHCISIHRCLGFTALMLIHTLIVHVDFMGGGFNQQQGQQETASNMAPWTWQEDCLALVSASSAACCWNKLYIQHLKPLIPLHL